MRMVVLPGDGIGPEITSATTQVLQAASEHFQLGVADRGRIRSGMKACGSSVRRFNRACWRLRVPPTV